MRTTSPSRRRTKRWAYLGALALLAGLVAIPASGVGRKSKPAADGLVAHVSQSVQFHYYLRNPEQAPARLRETLKAFGRLSSAAGSSGAASAAFAPITNDVFNLDDVGLPQNEESVAVSGRNVVSGTNDYRGLLDPEVNFTGWHLSVDRGATVANEGLLPSVSLSGDQTPSGGDPVYAFFGGSVYAGSLAYDANDPFGVGGPQANGITIYKSDVTTLSGCPGGSDPSCWQGAAAAETSSGDGGHFFDKEWIAAGDTGDGTHVWVVWSDFNLNFSAPLGYTAAQIRAVRCDGNLANCTTPILISGTDADVQFGDVTIGPDGRTYVTWAEIQGELTGDPQTFVIKMAIADAGSTTFGPTHVVATEANAIPFGGFLHANDFRVATYPKNDVFMKGETARVYVAWDRCKHRVLDTICEEPQIKLAFSDNDGATWKTKTVSAGGDNYFPTLDVDPATGQLAVAWYTNRSDSFHHRFRIELVTVNANNASVTNRQLIGPPNEPDADPLLGGFFIGDYIEVQAVNGKAFMAYNANYATLKLLGEGVPIFQQDNYLTKVGL